MGMLFNTAATVDILAVVNTVFSKEGLKRIRQNTSSWQGVFSSLPPAGGTYKALNNPSSGSGLNMDLDDGKGLRSANWQAWLGILDDSTMINPDQGATGSINVSTYIGKHISTVIGDASFAQIEFFAVPGTDPSASSSNIGAVALPYSDQATDKSLIITIKTATLDKLLAANLGIGYASGSRRRRPRQRGDE
jgi:hypothetical protein